MIKYAWITWQIILKINYNISSNKNPSKNMRCLKCPSVFRYKLLWVRRRKVSLSSIFCRFCWPQMKIIIFILIILQLINESFSDRRITRLTTARWEMWIMLKIIYLKSKKILNESESQMHHLTSTRKPNVISINKKKISRCQVDFAVSADYRLMYLFLSL